MYAIEAIPAFTDNYIWLIRHHQEAAVIDPGDAAVVHAHLKNNHLDLRYILITHWHPDHTGGIAKLLSTYPNAIVIGPKHKAITPVHQLVEDNSSSQIWGLDFQVLAVPGHTLEHIAYYCSAENILFCGDTLFSGGCGRMFEGDAPMFSASLGRIKALPDVTSIYCTHEYTLSNLDFAQAVEPDNSALQQYLIRCQKLRADDKITLPSTVGLEKKINPFLRLNHEDVITQALNQGAASTMAVDIFATLREWKNNF